MNDQGTTLQIEKRSSCALCAAAFRAFLYLSISHVIHLLKIPNEIGNGAAWLFLGEFAFLWVMSRLTREAFGKEDSVLKAHAAGEVRKAVKRSDRKRFCFFWKQKIARRRYMFGPIRPRHKWRVKKRYMR